jgi:hypothetical protein
VFAHSADAAERLPLLGGLNNVRAAAAVIDSPSGQNGLSKASLSKKASHALAGAANFRDKKNFVRIRDLAFVRSLPAK